jgi:hypothetical protein
MSNAPPPDNADFEPARQLTNLPGIVLFISGLLSALLALYLLIAGIQIMLMTPDKYEDLIRESVKNYPSVTRYLDEQLSEPGAIDSFKSGTTLSSIVWGGVSFVVGVLVCFGGLMMRRLRAYGVAVTAAFVAVVPCLSCTSCCGFGEVAGIWALIVLLHPEVRSAFR